MAELWDTLTHGFQGKIGTTRAESEPWWPEPRRAPKGAPNIVIVYMDDMGYADVGCFGSEIDTPHIDALAARGLRFNHYTTHWTAGMPPAGVRCRQRLWEGFT